jgi:hypothetical protein
MSVQTVKGSTCRRARSIAFQTGALNLARRMEDLQAWWCRKGTAGAMIMLRVERTCGGSPRSAAAAALSRPRPRVTGEYLRCQYPDSVPLPGAYATWRELLLASSQSRMTQLRHPADRNPQCRVRIPTIPISRSSGSRSVIPIDPDQCGVA